MVFCFIFNACFNKGVDRTELFLTKLGEDEVKELNWTYLNVFWMAQGRLLNQNLILALV